jgi:hypothetical protein
LEGLVGKELYNLLHSFRRGVWMDEELQKASFIHSLQGHLGCPLWMKFFFIRLFMSRAWNALMDEKNSTKPLHSFTTRPSRALLIKKTLQTSSFIRRRVWMPSWMKNSTKLHSFIYKASLDALVDEELDKTPSFINKASLGCRCG